jgi:enterochelin esterase-like enzyme
LAGSGRIVHSELVDPALPRTLPFRIYIPPCADELRGDLPSLYLLHGLTFTDAQWDELGADEIAERLIASEQAPPFLMVMPWERRGLEFEATIVDYLVPYVEERYGASGDRELRAIGGISRGGGFALRIGMQNADLFGTIGLHSPAVLMPDMFNIPIWADSGPVPRIWIDIGDRDSLRFTIVDLRELLDELEIDYEFTSYPGSHTSVYWSAHVEDYIDWYVSNWQ